MHFFAINEYFLMPSLIYYIFIINCAVLDNTSHHDQVVEITEWVTTANQYHTETAMVNFMSVYFWKSLKLSTF